jgi:hypothetical protein
MNDPKLEETRKVWADRPDPAPATTHSKSDPALFTEPETDTSKNEAAFTHAGVACPRCGKSFKNPKALGPHKRHCSDRREMSPNKPARKPAKPNRETVVHPATTVNHPPHYNVGKIEVIAAIEDWQLGFCLGNVVKYVARAEHKGNALEDLKKAQWYLNRHIQSLSHEH